MSLYNDGVVTALQMRAMGHGGQVLVGRGEGGRFVCLYLTDVCTHCVERTVVPPQIEYLKSKVGFVKSIAQCS